MSKHCPTCGQEMPDLREGVALPAIKQRIFDLIRTRPGSNACDLVNEALGRSDQAAIRSFRAHVWQINELFAHTNVRIRGDKWRGYWLKRGKR